MSNVYESYAIYSESTDHKLIPKLDTEEMKPDMPNRIFNKVNVEVGDAIRVSEGYNCERIKLATGVYLINGISFVTMLSSGTPPVPPVPVEFLDNVYPGYCILYDAANPPTKEDMSKALCVGTMGTAYDSGPSIFEHVLKVEGAFMEISLGHQCDYIKPEDPDRPLVYIRMGGTDYHIGARISIFKIADI